MPFWRSTGSVRSSTPTPSMSRSPSGSVTSTTSSCVPSSAEMGVARLVPPPWHARAASSPSFEAVQVPSTVTRLRRQFRASTRTRADALDSGSKACRARPAWIRTHRRPVRAPRASSPRTSLPRRGRAPIAPRARPLVLGSVAAARHATSSPAGSDDRRRGSGLATAPIPAEARPPRGRSSRGAPRPARVTSRSRRERPRSSWSPPACSIVLIRLSFITARSRQRVSRESAYAPKLRVPRGTFHRHALRFGAPFVQPIEVVPCSREPASTANQGRASCSGADIFGDQARRNRRGYCM